MRAPAWRHTTLLHRRCAPRWERRQLHPWSPTFRAEQGRRQHCVAAVPAVLCALIALGQRRAAIEPAMLRLRKGCGLVICCSAVPSRSAAAPFAGPKRLRGAASWRRRQPARLAALPAGEALPGQLVWPARQACQQLGNAVHLPRVILAGPHHFYASHIADPEACGCKT